MKRKARNETKSERTIDVRLLIYAVCSIFFLTAAITVALTVWRNTEPKEAIQTVERMATLGITGIFAVLAGKRVS